MVLVLFCSLKRMFLISQIEAKERVACDAGAASCMAIHSPLPSRTCSDHDVHKSP